MNSVLKLLGVAVVLVYLCVTFFSIWKLYSPKSNEFSYYEKHGLPSNGEHHQKFKKLRSFSLSEEKKIEVWGKAAIGTYFWIHIFKGGLAPVKNSLVTVGNSTVHSMLFTFRSGPGLIQTTVPFDVENLVMILNGRSQEKIAASTLWLDYLPNYSNLKKIAVILLGSEECENHWILPYMKSQGGKIDFAFLIYDSPLIDNKEIYQWPLGVATYRGFPNILPGHVDINLKRPFICNFLGTIYENSSRVLLTTVIQASGYQSKCIIKPRSKWLPLETKETFNSYMSALSNSDLTLSPVGKNSECYRIYEAMSLGSIPVIEDIVTPGSCDTSYRSPLRLLKKYNAPVIYIKDWSQLPKVLKFELTLSLTEKVKRRKSIIEWYQQFKSIMKDQFVRTVKQKFFNE